MKMDIVAYLPKHLETILWAGFLLEMRGALSVQVPLNTIKAGAHYDPGLVVPLMPISEDLKAKVQEAFTAFGFPVMFCRI